MTRVSPHHAPPLEDLIAKLQFAMHEDDCLETLIRSIEQAVILAAMSRHNSWRRVQKGLKIPRSTFYEKRHALGIGAERE